MHLDVRQTQTLKHTNFAYLCIETMDERLNYLISQSECINWIFAINIGAFAFGVENYLVEKNSQAK
jgi:hypothetical protein